MTIFLMLFAISLSETPQSPIHPEIWKVASQGIRTSRTLFAVEPVLLKLTEDASYIPDWTDAAKAEDDGTVSHSSLRGGWAYGELESEEDRNLLLEGTGFSSFFVNGERFVGDYYSHGILRIPIPIKKGINRFFVRPRGGSFKFNLIPTTETCSISPYDSLLPDMREGSLLDSYGAVVILNHTGQFLADTSLEIGDSKVFEKTQQKIPPLLPYGIAKPAFPLKQLRQPMESEIDEKGIYKLPITLNHGQFSQIIQLTMQLRLFGQPYKVTKLSGIDGSVQYYAVRPPYKLDKSPYLYLTLHGAAVEATGQIGAYSSKNDGFIVAPTNRRPYGFDWQEWGRMDALETLDLFMSENQIDPERVYLTGHSMGGHGVWYLGALYPSRFAAIGPSAGWISFSSYGRRSQPEQSEKEKSSFDWANMENDTLALIENYTDLPIYAIHGEKDDNVPVEQCRRMVSELEKFHKDFVYHEEPEAGHWWDNNTTPGAECVDWIPLFEFFRRHVRTPYPLSIKFKMPNPAISATYSWLTIHSQIQPSSLSSVTADADPRIGTIKIATDNVERLELNIKDLIPQKEAKIQIDGTEFSTLVEFPVYLLKDGDSLWKLTESPDKWSKGPHRSGPFKLAFDKEMVWVYSTAGSDEEDAAILAKVRYDAQSWWYRGNGNVTIIPDNEFDPDAYMGRNVILYGNSHNNLAFGKLLKDCPIQINSQKIKVGVREYEGDLGTFFVYPRPESDENLIGVIGFTSPKAARMILNTQYFISGVACPDYVVFGIETLSKGMDGVTEAGYFDNQWGLK